MKNIKNLIIVLIIVLIGFIIAINVLDNDDEKNITDSYEKNYEHVLEIKQVSSRNDFVSVENCVIGYVSAVNSKVENLVYSLLDKNYINKNNITRENVLERTNINNEEPSYIAKEMYVQTYENILVYPVYGIIYTNMNINQDSEDYVDTSYLEYKEEDFYCTVIVDYGNMTYSITPNTKEEYENNKKSYIEEKSIDKNQYNTFIMTNYNYSKEEAFIQRYFEDYLRCMKFNKAEAYSKLLPEYRELKYSSEADFNTYCNLLEDDVSIISYKINYKEEYTDYICVDDLYNYYIFREYSLMNYNVLLDTYTIQDEEDIAEYKQLSVGQKVMTNINKYIEMINTKDYKCAYQTLDEIFRNNKFSDLGNFAAYVNQNFYKHNKITEFTYTVEQDLYICDITLVDASQKNNTKINKTFIMQLKENGEFAISFNI